MALQCEKLYIPFFITHMNKDNQKYILPELIEAVNMDYNDHLYDCIDKRMKGMQGLLLMLSYRQFIEDNITNTSITIKNGLILKYWYIKQILIN